MIKLLTFSLLFVLTLSGYGQSYSNDWLEGKYDQNWMQFKVINEGIHRLTLSDFESAGIQASSFNGANMQVYFEGIEVPIYVSTPGKFSNLDFMEFVAHLNTSGIEKEFFESESDMLDTSRSIYSDTAVYFITWNNKTNNLRYTIQANELSDLPTKEAYFIHKTGVDYNVFNTGEPFDITGRGTKLTNALYGKGEGVASSNIIGNNFGLITFPCAQIYDGGPVANIEVLFVGRNDDIEVSPDHHVQIEVGNTSVDQTFEGYDKLVINKTIPLADLDPDDNKYASVTVSSLQDLMLTDIVGISYIDLYYPRTYDFTNIDEMIIPIVGGTENKYLEIENWDDESSTPILFDSKNLIRMEGIMSNDLLKVLLPTSTNERRLYLKNEVSLHSVIDLKEITFKDYSLLANQGDYIILTNARFFNDGLGNNYVQEYNDYRSNSFTPITIDIDDITNQFAYGRIKNPIAIRRFIDFAIGEWFIKPEYLFILGMASDYIYFRGPSGYKYMRTCYVPSWGNPSSDPLLTASDTSYIPRIPVGRLAVEDAIEIKHYLEKVKEHESSVENSVQSIVGKSWTKNVIHLGGGGDDAEQLRFSGYLKDFEKILEAPNFGANVHTFLKTSSDPIQNAISATFNDLIEDGTSLITFFGHSSGTKLEFSIYNPENYENSGKYPFMLSNGCYAGNIHTTSRTASRKFVLLEEKGAIGFLSATYLSFDKYDHDYSQEFLKNIGKDLYGESVGKSIVQAIKDIRYDSDPYILFTSNLYTLHGDPAIKLNPHEKPDYIVEEESTWFNPANISVNEDTFLINLTVTNIGKALDDTFNIIVHRKFPSGNSEMVYNEEFIATSFRDTFEIPIMTDPEFGLGYNEFTIVVDPHTEIDQIPEMDDIVNNTITKGILILSDDIIPLHPFDNSIVTKPNVELIASIANVFSGAKDYVIELDTNSSFENPIASIKKSNKGGLLKWEPEINYVDGQAYFWRASLDSSFSDKFVWHNSSFTYHSSWQNGWNQNHVDQLADNDWVNLNQNDFGVVNYVNDLKDIHVLTFNREEIPSDSLYHADRGCSVNGVQINASKCLTNIGGHIKSGVAFMVFQRESLLPIQNPFIGSYDPYGGQFGSYHCDSKTFNGFEFFDSTYDDAVQTQIRRRNIQNFINQVDDGDYILAYIYPENVITRTWPDSLYKAFESFGAQQVRNIPDYSPYVVFGQKGNLSYQVVEEVGSNPGDVVDVHISVNGFWSEGYVESELIGPAYNWKEVTWNDHASDKISLIDSNIFSLIGVSGEGVETVLESTITGGYFDLSNINSRDYPFLKMRFFTADDSLRTPSWIQDWKVYYDSYPEMALNANAHCNCSIDTLYEGEEFELSIALENVTKVDMDSLLMDVRVIGENNETYKIDFPKLDSLRAKDTIIATIKFNTMDKTGDNQLSISANDAMEQPEVTLFNNIGYLPFFVVADNANPLMDVTFDGEHILDGDIVSGEPEILISLKDENEFLPLNDTALFKIYLEYPDGTIDPITFDDQRMTFIPATSDKKNKAQIVLKPIFKVDGIYKLRVYAEDRTGNASGRVDYSISFEVILKSTITRILNYPNPFTTSTRFVFTLTGSKVPDFLLIQILTVSGTVVKEIDLTELGPIHVGRNISEYAWNGTDEFGDKLANGIYFYRVVTSIEGDDIERRATKADQYFKSGFGKMTIIR